MKIIIPSYTIKALIASILAIFAMSILSKMSKILTIVLFFIILILYWFDPSVSIIFYLVLGIIGVVAEETVIMVCNKAWKYHDKHFLNTSYWLFPLWGIGGGAILGIYKFFLTNNFI